MGILASIRDAHKSFLKYDRPQWPEFSVIDWLKLPFVYIRALYLLTIDRIENGIQ